MLGFLFFDDYCHRSLERKSYVVMVQMTLMAIMMVASYGGVDNGVDYDAASACFCCICCCCG